MNRVCIRGSVGSALAASAALVAAGCATEGGLGQISARPGCASSDLMCLSEGFSAPLATDGSVPVEISVETAGVAAPALMLESVDSSVFSVSDLTLTGGQPGMAALLISEKGGVVLDFVHIWVEEPNRLGIYRHGGSWDPGEELTAPIQLLAGDEVILSAAMFHDQQQLLGSDEVDWTEESDAFDLLQVGHPSYRRLVARQEGSGSLSASMLGLSAELEVEVMP